MKRSTVVSFVASLSLALAASAFLTACSSSGSGSRAYSHPGAGYRGYYRRPWGARPIYGVGVEVIDPVWDIDGGAVQLPAMGMPDMGGGMDMGGFDW